MLATGLGALFFSSAFLTGHAILPAELLHALYPWGAYFEEHRNHNSELNDAILQCYPWFLRWREQVLAGAWPLWNPDSGVGQPFAGNPQMAAYSPLAAFSLADPILGWNLVLLARLVIAGTAMFVWLRSLGRTLTASVLGGIAFGYTMPFLSWLPWPHANVNGLVPLLFWSARGTATRPGPRSAAALALVLLAMLLGGQPESAFVGTAAAVVIWLYEAGRRRGTPPWAPLATLAAGGMLGAITAALHIVPFLEYLGKSRVLLEKGHESLALPPFRLITWIVPTFFGRQVDRNPWPEGVGNGFLSFGAYAGASLLALALLAVFATRPRRTLPCLTAALFVVGLAYALPPVSLLLRLPIVGKTMVHHTLSIASAAVVTLAAIGWDRLTAIVRRRSIPLYLRTLAVPLALAAVAGLALLAYRGAVAEPLFRATALSGAVRAVALLLLPWGVVLVPSRLRTARFAAAIGLVVVDLWPIAMGYHGAVPRSMVFFPTGLTRFLSADPEAFRVLPLRFILVPNLNLPYRIQSLISYDGIDSLEQARFLRKLGGYDGTGLYSTVFPERLSNARVAELLNVRYLLDEPRAPRLDTEAFHRRTGFRLRLVYDAPDGRAYRLDSSAPRAWFTAAAAADPGLSQFDSLLEARDPRVLSTAFLDTPSIAPTTAPAAAGGARITSYAWGSIELEVRADAPGWLVLSEMYDPGWKATVDGRPTRVHRANGILRAVSVPQGSARVRFVYQPASLHLGLLLSLLGIAAIAWAGTRRPPPGRSAPGPSP